MSLSQGSSGLHLFWSYDQRHMGHKRKLSRKFKMNLTWVLPRLFLYPVNIPIGHGKNISSWPDVASIGAVFTFESSMPRLP